MWVWTTLALAGEVTASANDTAGDVEAVLVEEMARVQAQLAAQPEAPHHVAVTVQDWEEVAIHARDGALSNDTATRNRTLDVDLRTGTPALDSTHPLRGFSSLSGEDRAAVHVALDEGYALRHALWREIDARFRDAAERIVVIRANQNVKVAEEAVADDFEPRPPVVDRQDVPALDIDRPAWSDALQRTSRALQEADAVHTGQVSLTGERVVTTLVDSAGTRLVHGRRHARLSLTVASTAADGDQVSVFRALDVHDPARLPDPSELDAWAVEAVEQLEARLAAPRGAPYSGPVLLRGEAAGVFFHEVLGHRVEGHRQKREDEGRTFAEQVGRSVLPSWIDVYDDPRIAELHGEQLNGHYLYDDEGVAADRAELVTDGRFVGFLMSRSPIPGFDHSNGHGRRSTGNVPLARMGNTVVEASRTSSDARLRSRLLAQVRRQGLPYGYIVDEIEGGFTMTGRVTPNAFNVRASTTWRVYADGRPDELVRGIDLVGTPLVAFSNLIAAGDEPAVFNGSCGAESGWVPVSAVAPSLLFSRLEFQLKEKGQDRPPLLAKPSAPATDGSSDAEMQP
ncbi:MAG: hypothetical protein KTR31_05545 [Myxococcales bacterium]|nr:hypothetical protein [Myxococcales bacterium]